MQPKPVQDHVPLLIGGGGEKVTMRIAAQYADEWNMWGLPELLEQKGKVLDAHCERLGRDPTTSALGPGAALPERRPGVAGPVQGAADACSRRSSATSPRSRASAGYVAAGVDELIIPTFNLGPPAAHQRHPRPVQDRSRPGFRLTALLRPGCNRVEV